ncbi:hypothetical protein AYO38_04160 [bacterium SCGC AG-212-C10]|nr:hypothetical protein AYO38_04160 [bacterium SCGC AG-212-C10]
MVIPGFAVIDLASAVDVTLCVLAADAATVNVSCHDIAGIIDKEVTHAAWGRPPGCRRGR